MSSKILNYSNWKRIYESAKINEGLLWDVTEKEPIGGTTHKVKVKYLDTNSIKVKAVNDRDLVGEGGVVAQDLMDNIVAFLNSHDKTDFAREYPALQDLPTFYKDNFFTYNVKKENDRRQVIVFSIQKRANFKGVTPESKLLSDDAAAKLAQAPEAKAVLAKSDKSILQNTAAPVVKAAAVSATKIEKPIPLADLKGESGKSGAPAFDAIDTAYSSLKGVKEISALPFFAKLKAELKAGQLGDTSISFAKGIIAGFGLKDKYDDPIEVLNQPVVDKLAAFNPAPAATAQNSSRQYYLGLNGKRLVEQAAPASPAATTPAPAAATPAPTAATPAPAASTLPTGFDLKAFTDAVGGAAPAALSTGDIKVPDGGIKKGVAAKGDAELVKAQKLIADKLGVVLAKDPTFIKFKGYGPDGNYGPTTEKMVAMAKAGFELKDTDGSTITTELINKLLTDKITESYLDLRGNLFEKFNVDAATKTSSAYVPGKKSAEKPAEKPTTDETANKTAAGNAVNIINSMKAASEKIQTYFNTPSNFAPYSKGTFKDDDEAGAVKAYQTWYNSFIIPKHTDPAKIEVAKIVDASEKAIVQAAIDSTLQALTTTATKLGGVTTDDSYTWNIVDLEGAATNYKVDTDF